MIPFLVANCVTIIGGIVGLVLIIFKSDDLADESGDFTTALPDASEEIETHKTMFIIIAIALIALSCHSWFVIFALYKHDSNHENKIVDDVIASAASKYPPLQSVATVDDGLRFTYK